MADGGGFAEMSIFVGLDGLPVGKLESILQFQNLTGCSVEEAAKAIEIYRGSKVTAKELRQKSAIQMMGRHLRQRSRK